MRLAAPLIGGLITAISLVAQLRMATPAPSSAASPPTNPTASPNANYYRVKQVKLIDTHGFERPFPAISLLIPTDWKFQGDTLWGAVSGCNEDMVRAAFRASSADGRVVLESFPWFAWQWADDAFSQRSLEANNQQMVAFGRKACPVNPPASAADLLQRTVLPKYRAGKQVAAIEAMPDMNQELAAQARQTEAQWAEAGMPIKIRADAARARLQYSVNGQAVEEWVMAVSSCTARAMPNPAAMMEQGGPRQSNLYDCQGLWLMSLRAPQGQLLDKERLFKLIRSTVRLEPEWLSRVTQVASNVAAVQQKGAADRAEIVRKSNEDISRIITNGYNQRSKIQERTQEEVDQTIRGVQTYRNPATGDTFELSSQFNHAWMNGANEYILTDDANFNPNSRLGGNWTTLQPVRPQ